MNSADNRVIGMFFIIDDKKFVTMVDYRSKGRFKQLLERFSENAKIYEPQHGDNFKFINLEMILHTAYESLENKHRASKLIYTIMAQNNISSRSSFQI